MRSHLADDWEAVLSMRDEAGTADRAWRRYFPSHPRRATVRDLAYFIEEVDPATMVLMEFGSTRSPLPPAPLRAWRDPDAEIAALREEQRRLQDRVERLEHRLEALLAEPADTVPIDPHTRWIESNLDTLRRHPGEWIALHPARGIVFHTASDDEFAAMLDALAPGERDEILAFHSSMYL